MALQDPMTGTHDTPPQAWRTRADRIAHHPAMRWGLAGPAAAILSVMVMMGMGHWWPRGAAGVDNLAMPVILFPLIWAALFFYAILEERMLRGVIVFAALLIFHIGFLAINLG
ncbi:MAG: hypothetical protein AAGB05_09105 [Pseudomonadota bacterium]